ncbi:MAG: GNAT family N-acetyltransferase [Faecousia sp.]
MDNLRIRREKPGDYRAVEELTRDAFWNLQVPGCNEHYLAHVLRGHPDFIPELDLVAERDGRVVGNIMYTKAWLEDEAGNRKEILTFGPLSVAPECQRQGIGKQLMEASFRIAAELGYDTVVIFGHPGNYVSSGFKNCARYHISMEGIYPTAMLVRPLRENALDGRAWSYRESNAYEIDDQEAEEFDRGFEPREKAYRASQEEFFIYSHSTVNI